jgi:molecular chaperone GrpE
MVQNGNKQPANSDAGGVAAQGAQGNGAGPAQPGGDDLQAQLSEEKSRADGYLAQLQRATADFQNYKRRTEQERNDYGRLANIALVLNFLPAIDDLDRAVSNLDPSVTGQSWVEGIQAIQRKLRGALEASGVTEIRAESEPFDPNIHEAISQVSGEHGQVISEVQRGYRLAGRVIRPALVIVGNGEPGA